MIVGVSIGQSRVTDSERSTFLANRYRVPQSHTVAGVEKGLAWVSWVGWRVELGKAAKIKRRGCGNSEWSQLDWMRIDEEELEFGEPTCP